MALQYQVDSDPVLLENEQLRMELGWPEVGKGLLQIVLGYGVFVVGMVIGIGLIVLSVMGTGENGRRAPQPGMGQLWMFYIGLGITSITGLISYGFILAGKFKCLLNSSERNGARWFMFLCITCLFMGPLLNLASGLAFSQKWPELKKGAQSLEDIQLSEMGRTIQMVGFVAGLLYPLFFLLFLRSIAVCMRSSSRTMLVNLFLALCAVLVGLTVYQWFIPKRQPLPMNVVLIIQAGWGVLALLYVVVILAVRGCIDRAMGEVRNPLEMYG